MQGMERGTRHPRRETMKGTMKEDLAHRWLADFRRLRASERVAPMPAPSIISLNTKLQISSRAFSFERKFGGAGNSSRHHDSATTPLLQL